MKSILLSVVFITMTLIISAQRTDAYFGVKAGLNIASLNVEDGVDFNSRASAHVGVLAHIHLTSHFAVQPELFLSGQGGKDGNEQLKLLYLNLPLLLQYMTGNGFRLYTGPQLGVLLSAKDKTGDVEVDFKDELKSVDFSWAFGAGYQFPGSGLGIDARYNLGISNINDGSTTVQNRVFAVGLFYQFMPTVVHRR
jgi:hypothetical protein